MYNLQIQEYYSNKYNDATFFGRNSKKVPVKTLALKIIHL